MIPHADKIYLWYVSPESDGSSEDVSVWTCCSIADVLNDVRRQPTMLAYWEDIDQYAEEIISDFMSVHWADYIHNPDCPKGHCRCEACADIPF